MSKSLNRADRDTHLESVIKSNLVGFNLPSADIDFITENLTADIISALEEYEFLENNNNEEE